MLPGCEKCRSWPVSRILCVVVPRTRRDNHSSRPAIAHRLVRPTRWLERAVLDAILFGLAPCGVLPAIRVATDAVRSYRTFSPLLASVLRTTAQQAVRACRAEAPKGAKAGGIFSVPLIRQVTLPGRYPAHCPMEFGLSSRPRRWLLRTRARAGGRLADCDVSLSRTWSNSRSGEG